MAAAMASGSRARRFSTSTAATRPPPCTPPARARRRCADPPRRRAAAAGAARAAAVGRLCGLLGGLPGKLAAEDVEARAEGHSGASTDRCGGAMPEALLCSCSALPERAVGVRHPGSRRRCRRRRRRRSTRPTRVPVRCRRRRRALSATPPAPATRSSALSPSDRAWTAARRHSAARELRAPPTAAPTARAAGCRREPSCRRDPRAARPRPVIIFLPCTVSRHAH